MGIAWLGEEPAPQAAPGEEEGKELRAEGPAPQPAVAAEQAAGLLQRWQRQVFSPGLFRDTTPGTLFQLQTPKLVFKPSY